MTATTQHTGLPEAIESSEPNRWQKLRIKNLLQEVDERSKDGKGMLLSLSRTRGLIPYSSATGRPPSAASLIGYKICRPGQIVMNRMQAWSGVFALSHHTGLVSPDYAVFTPTTLALPEYLIYLLRSPHLVSLFAAESKGIGTGFNRLYTERFGAIPVALPDVRQQEAIARYLAFQDRNIARLVANKRRLIALLNEEKQAIIQQAVTRGLDPDVPMKPSGEEWLGEIPAHWHVASLGTLSSLIQTGPFGSQLHSSEYVENGIPVINPSHLRDGRITPDMSVAVSEATAERLNRHQLRVGDIVAARRGELGRCAVVTAVESGWLCGTGSLIIRPRSALVGPDFLQLVFSSQGVSDALELASVGSTMNNLSAGLVSRQRIQVLPVPEQNAIVDFIRSERQIIETAIERINREIDLIREYRTRLIADIVTGQLDVREAAASLPDIEDEAVEPAFGVDEVLGEGEEFSDDDLDATENADAAD